jgi:hypothetical protein
VLAGGVAHAKPVADHEGGDLRAEVFFGVPDAAEATDQVPVQSGGMATLPETVTGGNWTEPPAAAVGVSASCPGDLPADTPLAVRKRRELAVQPPLGDRQQLAESGRSWLLFRDTSTPDGNPVCLPPTCDFFEALRVAWLRYF